MTFFLEEKGDEVEFLTLSFVPAVNDGVGWYLRWWGAERSSPVPSQTGASLTVIYNDGICKSNENVKSTIIVRDRINLSTLPLSHYPAIGMWTA